VSPPRAHEEALLDPARRFLLQHADNLSAAGRDEVVMRLLEAASACIGGFPFAWYANQAPWGDRRVSPPSEAAKALAEILLTLPIPPPLALASLAQPELSPTERRKSGVYYTDFRLAEYLTRPLSAIKARSARILDPASGTGILLAAAVLAVTKPGKERSRLLGNGVCAADLSARALRGAALALASLTDDQGAIASMLTRLRQGDSLLSGKVLWADVAPDGFDIVVGNPPWEKLKLSRHEFLKSNGVHRHYGEEYQSFESGSQFFQTKNGLLEYARQLEEKYGLQGSGEHDLYKFFLELAVQLTRTGGRTLLIVPAGLIRSQGTGALRRFIFDKCSGIEFTVLENRARFFSILHFVSEPNSANGERARDFLV
jgi:hypothetical protein